MQTLYRIADWTRQDEPRFAGLRAALVLAGLFVALAVILALFPDASPSSDAVRQLIALSAA